MLCGGLERSDSMASTERARPTRAVRPQQQAQKDFGWSNALWRFGAERQDGEQGKGAPDSRGVPAATGAEGFRVEQFPVAVWSGATRWRARKGRARLARCARSNRRRRISDGVMLCGGLE